METRYLAYPLVLLLGFAAAIASWCKKSFLRLVGAKWSYNSLIFDGLGPSCRIVKEGAARWPSLQELYSYPAKRHLGRYPGRLFDDMWLLGLKNPRAVRNRLRLVVDILSEELEDVLSRQDSACILSLACGSAEAVIQALVRIGEEKAKRVRVVLLDQDETALAYALEESGKHGLTVEVVRSNVARLRKAVNVQPDIVEMVGLLDYLDDGTATRLMESISNKLRPGGLFVTANIVSNPEILFLRHCADWDMIYRSPKKLRDLCSYVFNSGVRVVAEPLGIHTVALCRKA